MVNIIDVNEYEELDEQVPIKVYRHEEQYLIDEKEEQMYEGAFALYEDKNPWSSRDDFAFLLNKHSDEFPEDVPIGDGQKRHSVFEVISVSEHWLSDMELDNPYWAIYPNHQYKDGHIVRYNPNRNDTLELNKVPRKHTDRISQYMGDPNYIQDKQDKLIYYNVKCLSMLNKVITLKVFAPEYNRYYTSQVNKFIKDANTNKIYVPVYNNGSRWMIDSFSDPSKQVKLFRKVSGQYWSFNSEEFNPINTENYYMQDKEIIERVNNIVNEHQLDKPSSPTNEKQDVQTVLI